MTRLVIRPPMFVGADRLPCEEPGALGRAFATLSRSTMTRATGASRTGQEARAWNQVLRALCDTNRGAGTPVRRGLRGPAEMLGSARTIPGTNASWAAFDSSPAIGSAATATVGLTRFERRDFALRRALTDWDTEPLFFFDTLPPSVWQRERRNLELLPSSDSGKANPLPHLAITTRVLTLGEKRFRQLRSHR